MLDIRRVAPPEKKAEIKLANPNILTLLMQHYQSTDNAVMKALIKELMIEAGGEWKDRIHYSIQRKHRQQAEKKSDKSKRMVYRGQVIYA